MLIKDASGQEKSVTRFGQGVYNTVGASAILFMQGYNFEINNIVIDFSKISCALSFCTMVNRFSLSDLCFALLDKTGKDTK